MHILKRLDRRRTEPDISDSLIVMKMRPARHPDGRRDGLVQNIGTLADVGDLSVLPFSIFVDVIHLLQQLLICVFLADKPFENVGETLHD